MDANGKNKMAKVVKKEEAFLDSADDEEYHEQSCMQEDGNINANSKKKKAIVAQKGSTGSGGGGGGGLRNCQAEKCMADLRDAKPYHRRHKVCEIHAKAQVVLVGGIRQRFCQQCSSHMIVLIGNVMKQIP